LVISLVSSGKMDTTYREEIGIAFFDLD